MNKPKNFSFLPTIFCFLVVAFLLYFRKVIMTALLGTFKKNPDLSNITKTGGVEKPIASPDAIIKTKLQSLSSIVKHAPVKKISLKSIPQKNILLTPPLYDQFPFIPKKKDAWVLKPFEDFNVKPFNTNLFSI